MLNNRLDDTKKISKFGVNVFKGAYYCFITYFAYHYCLQKKDFLPSNVWLFDNVNATETNIDNCWIRYVEDFMHIENDVDVVLYYKLSMGYHLHAFVYQYLFERDRVDYYDMIGECYENELNSPEWTPSPSNEEWVIDNTSYYNMDNNDAPDVGNYNPKTHPLPDYLDHLQSQDNPDPIFHIQTSHTLLPATFQVVYRYYLALGTDLRVEFPYFP